MTFGLEGIIVTPSSKAGKLKNYCTVGFMQGGSRSSLRQPKLAAVQ